MAIARALAAEPRLMILDESVAALDVSIQAQVLNLLADIRDRTGVSYLLISHDLAVVRQLTDQTIVMQRGRIVERGPTAACSTTPRRSTPSVLRASVPRPGWKPSPADANGASGRMNDPTRPVAQTPLGAVRGERVGAVSRFLGVPYARLVGRFLPAGPGRAVGGCARRDPGSAPACPQVRDEVIVDGLPEAFD